MRMKRIIEVSGVIVAAALASAAPAEARGCLKGALVGGMAGHYAGHHGLIGAVGGCLAGRHLANRHTMPVSNPNAPPMANRSSNY